MIFTKKIKNIFKKFNLNLDKCFVKYLDIFINIQIFCEDVEHFNK